MTDIHLTVISADLEEGLDRIASQLWQRRVHSVYIDPARCGTVHAAGAALHARLQEMASPGRQTLTSDEEDHVRQLRGSYAFRSAQDPRVSLFASETLQGWTIICEEDPLFAFSGAPRQLFVKPVPESWNEALFFVQPPLDHATLWPWPPPESVARKLSKTLPPDRLRPLDPPTSNR